MPNYRRAKVAGGTYFFTVVTLQRRSILTTPPARNALREALRETRRRRTFALDAVVLLPNHLHAIWTLPRGDGDFSTRWNRIKARFTRRFLLSGGEECSGSVSRSVRGERGVWQRRFFEHAIRDEADLKQCVDYLHINPVKHGLVDRARDWLWSSFHRYVRLGEYDADWGGSAEFFGDGWDAYE